MVLGGGEGNCGPHCGRAWTKLNHGVSPLCKVIKGAKIQVLHMLGRGGLSNSRL